MFVYFMALLEQKCFKANQRKKWKIVFFGKFNELDEIRLWLRWKLVDFIYENLYRNTWQSKHVMFTTRPHWNFSKITSLSFVIFLEFL